MLKRMRGLRAVMGSIRNKAILFGISITLVAVLLLTSIFFLWYRGAMTEDYRELVSTRLSDTDVVFSKYIESARNLASGWFNSNNGTLCRIGTGFDIMDHILFIDSVSDTLWHNTYIQSMYIINNKSEVTLWIKGEGPYTEDLDGLLVEKLRMRPARQSPFVWTVKNRYAQKADVKLLTIFFSNAPLGSVDYTGTVVVNINLEALCSGIFSEQSNRQADRLYIVDRDGNVVIHSDRTGIGECWGDRPYIQSILANGNAAFRASADGVSYEFMSVKSKLNGFYVVSQSDSIGGSPGVNSLITFMILLAILVSALVVFIMVAAGARVFQPLDTAIDDLKQSSLIPVSESDHDEAKFLRRYHEQVSERITSLSRREEHDFIAKNLILGERGRRSPTGMDIQPRLIETGVLSKEHAYYIVSVLFSDTDNPSGLAAVDAKRARLCDLYLNALNRLGHATRYELGIRHVAFFVSETDVEPVSEDSLTQALRQARDAAEAACNARISTIASERIPRGEESCLPYFNAAEELLWVRAIYGDGEIAFCGATPPGDAQVSADAIAAVLSALKKREREGYMRAVESVTDGLKACTYRQFINGIADVSEQILKVRAAAESRNASPRTSALRTQIEAVSSLSELTEWFARLYDDVTETIERVDNRSMAGAIEDAVNYIRNHYDDDKLSAIILAERLHISAPYFGQLFKEFTGSSIPVYVVQVRMEKARDLLISDPDMDISQIARKVGYNSGSYFATTFKKFYGISPSKLRSGLDLPDE